MKKLFLKFGCLLFIVGVLWSLVTVLVFAWVETPITSYNAAAIDKQARLNALDQPKIVLVGGSNLAFGIDSAMIEEATGYQVVNLGLHAGMGYKFYTEMSKQNLREGDILVLSIEYDLLDGSYDPESVLHTLEIDQGLIKNLDRSLWEKTGLSLPEYTFNRAINTLLGKKSTYTGIYSRASFNEYGDIAVVRPENIMTNSAYDTFLKINPDLITKDFVDYMKAYKKFAESKGATVVFTFPCLNVLNLDPASDLSGFMTELIAKTGIKGVSDINDYILPDELFFDTHYHLNDLGVAFRSQQLIDDLESNLLNK
jgi:hypothetical protein